MKRYLTQIFAIFFIFSLSITKGAFSQEEPEVIAPEFDQITGLMKDIPALKGEDPTALIPNTDPGGIDDKTALDEDGNPIEFNLHVPPDFTKEVPLANLGLEKESPEDRLGDCLDEMSVDNMDVTERRMLTQEAMDILFGTNESGKLDNKAYLGFPLLNITSGNEEKIKRASEWNNTETFDENGNVDVKMLYYGRDIDCDTYLLEVPTALVDKPFSIKFTINDVVGLRCFAPTIMCQLPNPNFPAAEDAIPFGKFSNGPPAIPYGAYDASFYELDRLIFLDEDGNQVLDDEGNPFRRFEQGTQTEIVLAMPPGKFIKGIYTWGWRTHPPLTQFMVLLPEGELQPDGKTLAIDAFANGQAKSVDDIGDRCPEKIVYNALKEFDAENAIKENFVKLMPDSFIRTFLQHWVSPEILNMVKNAKDQIAVMKNKLQLPPGFEKDVNADFTAVYMNGETYVESQLKGGTGNNWILPPQKEGDVVKGTITNADNTKSWFRTVIFSRGQFQYGTPVDNNHNEFGIFNWKPIYGTPMFVAGGWKTAFGAVSQQNLYTNDHPDGDLQHDFVDFSGFSGPEVFGGPAGSDGLFDYGFGVPIEPGDTHFANIELPRNLSGNRSVLYLFDPMRHDNTVFSLHLPE